METEVIWKGLLIRNAVLSPESLEFGEKKKPVVAVNLTNDEKPTVSHAYC